MYYVCIREIKGKDPGHGECSLGARRSFAGVKCRQWDEADGCWSGGRTGERWKGHRDGGRGHCGEQAVKSIEGQADILSSLGVGGAGPQMRRTACGLTGECRPLPSSRALGPALLGRRLRP